MHTLIRVVLSAAVFSLATTSIHGAIFNYSYTFPSPDGLVVSGSLQGAQNGDYVDNVSYVTVFFNGERMLGSTVFIKRYTEQGNPIQWVDGAVVSFTALNNNFAFVSQNWVTGGSPDSHYLVINPQTGGFAEAYDNLGIDHLDRTVGGWSLVAVPEPSTYLAGLSALGMLGRFGWRNRQ